MSEPRKSGLPNHAQLVGEVRRVAAAVVALEARVEVLEGGWEQMAVTATLDALAEERPDTWGPSLSEIAAAASNNARCPGCGAIVGECADTCAYERKHAIRVERYGDDAA